MRVVQCLLKEVWQDRREKHQQVIRRFTQQARDRAARGKTHPVYDFFKTYYTYSYGRLEQWHPPLGVRLEQAVPALFSTRYYRYDQSGDCELDPTQIGEKEAARIHFTLDLLKRTQQRPGLFSCFGLHEWAMTYSGADLRHAESAPLRLSQAEIDAVVESRPLRCTHFDAYRFFAPPAQPRNQNQLTLEGRAQWEQPGCIHANMDLYKWAYKMMPWVGSELLLRCFLLAAQAREIDMRASPYDLSAWGYSSICVETRAGRTEYEGEQRALSEAGQELRAQLIQSLEGLAGTLVGSCAKNS